MKLTILYDNTTNKPDLTADWGWSCFIETEERNVLFDTGGNGKILLENMLNLGINPESIDDIVISHPDFDHIGGLSTFLNLNQKAIVHIPISFRGIRYPNQVKYYDKPTRIYGDIFLTGELDKREQSLAVKTKKGLVLVVGCGHPGVATIIDSISHFGKPYAIVGGLHGFDEFEILENIDTICPAHCTKYKDKIKSLYPEKYIEGGVGEVFEF
ncbi:MAG: MBL fold metallo-hydrolase [Candidatus Cloacimonetes bacterium]|nr:MBL fold metallo-hydrolase [Candidatus Cloacimonadota bacterium]